MSASTIQLNKSFDQKLLQDAFHALSDQEIKPANYPGDGSLNWNSLSVYTQGESAEKFQSYLPFINELDLKFRLVRFLLLEPGGIIKEHVDTFLSGRVVRLHIPVITHEKVDFHLDGLRQDWKAGEFWFGDFTKPHSVYNHSDLTRVHLVLDVAADEKLLELFDPGTVPARLFDSLKIEEQFDEKILERFKCDFKLPAGFKLPGSPFPPLETALIANFRLLDGEFCMFINDAPMVKAIPVTENKLSVLGMPFEMMAEYTFESDKVKTLTFHVGDRSLEANLV